MIQSLKFTGVEGREVGPLKRALQNKIKRNVFSLQKFAKIICNCQFMERDRKCEGDFLLWAYIYDIISGGNFSSKKETNTITII